MRIEDFGKDSTSEVFGLLQEVRITRFSREYIMSHPPNLKFTHSTHTKKSGIRRSDLLKLDPEYTALAQLMGLRYGYAVPVNSLAPPLRVHFCVEEHQCFADFIPDVDCSFNSANKWGCKLPFQDSD